MTALAAIERGAGAPIVLVHGVGASARSTFAAISTTLSADHRVIAVDLPGSGQSGDLAAPAEGWSIDAVADALAEALAERGVRGALLVGHSLGAAIVARCASRHPELPSCVVAVAVALDAETSSGVRLRLWRELFDTDRALLARYLLFATTTPARWEGLSPGEIDDLVEIAQVLIPAGTSIQLDLAAQSAIRDDLARLSVPATVVLGSEDSLVALQPWRNLEAEGGIDRLEVWDGGHDVMQHRRDDFCCLLTELASAPRRHRDERRRASSARGPLSTTTIPAPTKGTDR